jgi:predicted TIM-barrel fold metal-dependent hydrolase
VIVPNSSGTSRPRAPAPPDACDCHIHIYDPRFPMARPNLRAVDRASVADYRLLQKRLGTARTVVVQPAAYGTDNAVTLDAIAGLGIERTRGIAVVHPAVTDTELLAMKKGGVRGLRFTLHDARTAVTSADMIEPLAVRVNRLGWHVQLHLLAEQIVEMEALIARLPGTIVFDHMGRLPQPEGIHHRAFSIVRRLLDNGRTWVKLCGAYLNTRSGAPHYEDVKPIARAYIEHAPERCVWGSDWPHPTEPHVKPDDAVLFDLLHDWVPSEAVRQKILVDNADALYGFSYAEKRMPST